MIALGCDHGGFALKEEVKAHLQKRGLEVKDCGCYSTESCDYPVFGHELRRGRHIRSGMSVLL